MNLIMNYDWYKPTNQNSQTQQFDKLNIKYSFHV